MCLLFGGGEVSDSRGVSAARQRLFAQVQPMEPATPGHAPSSVIQNSCRD